MDCDRQAEFYLASRVICIVAFAICRRYPRQTSTQRSTMRGRARKPRKTNKILHQHSVLGQQGVNLIEKIVLRMGYAWHPSGNLETGIDGIIEIRDPVTGQTTNSIVQVQSKATEKGFQSETANTLEYSCSDRDIAYWLRGNAPVILIHSRPSTGEAYWVSIKDYFADPLKHNSRKIV